MALARGDRDLVRSGRLRVVAGCRHWCGGFPAGAMFRFEEWAEGCRQAHGTPYEARYVKVFHPAGGYGVFPAAWLGGRLEVLPEGDP